MLIRFAFENYRSFKNQQVFSMAAGNQNQHTEHLIVSDNHRLLKGSYFFGANASGKSNFVKALDFVRRMVVNGPSSISYEDTYFRMDGESQSKPSVFQVDFMAHEKTYSYGFVFDYMLHKVSEEWLYRLYPEQDVCIFERQAGKPFHTDLTLNAKSRLRFEIYSEDVGDDELLLSLMGSKYLAELLDVAHAVDWFKRVEVIYPTSTLKAPYLMPQVPYSRVQAPYSISQASGLTPNAPCSTLNTQLKAHYATLQASCLTHEVPRSWSIDEMYQDSQETAKLLRLFDTGIQDIVKVKHKAEDVVSNFPKDVAKGILDDIVQKLAQSSSHHDYPYSSHQTSDLNVQKDSQPASCQNLQQDLHQDAHQYSQHNVLPDSSYGLHQDSQHNVQPDSCQGAQHNSQHDLHQDSQQRLKQDIHQDSQDSQQKLQHDSFQNLQQPSRHDSNQGAQHSQLVCHKTSHRHFMLRLNDGVRYEVSTDNGELIAERWLMDHGNSAELFELIDESESTKRLLDLLPVYALGQHERVIVIDELDRSLHPKLVERYIQAFYDLTNGCKSQLICTTHDVQLMDLTILRSDEIWFVDRNVDQASSIYSLGDYKHIQDKDVRKDYLLGRYGAIPCFHESELEEEE